MHFARLDKGLVDENVKNPGVGEIDQGRQKRCTGQRRLTARRQHGQCGVKDGAANTESERIDAVGASNFLNPMNRLDRRLFDVVVPGRLGQRLIRIAPTYNKAAMSLGHDISDEGILGLQIQDVVLVDAGRYQQERTLVDLGRQRFVLDELEQFVLKDHGPLGRRDVATHLEQALVGH